MRCFHAYFNRRILPQKPVPPQVTNTGDEREWSRTARSWGQKDKPPHHFGGLVEPGDVTGVAAAAISTTNGLRGGMVSESCSPCREGGHVSSLAHSGSHIHLGSYLPLPPSSGRPVADAPDGSVPG